jgi:acetyl esterase
VPKIPIPARLERPLLKALLGAPEPVLRRLAGPPRRSADGYELDPQIQLLLRMMRLAGEPELHEGTIRDARQRMLRSGSMLDYAEVRGVTTENRTIPGPASALAARVYRPRGRGKGGLVFFHGGGFVLGSIDSHDGVCRALAERARITVVSVDYRLAPEHPFPAAVEDAIAATRWVLENAESLGLAPDAIAVGGDSAGGNLSAVASLALAREARCPAFQLLVYPAVDFTRSHRSHALFREGLVLSEASIDWFLERYLAGRDLHRDPRVSPLFVEDLEGLPPALVFTAGFDPLRDEGSAYAARMRDAGVDVEHVCAEGMPHGFFNMGGIVRTADQLIHHAAARVRRALGG